MLWLAAALLGACGELPTVRELADVDLPRVRLVDERGQLPGAEEPGGGAPAADPASPSASPPASPGAGGASEEPQDPAPAPTPAPPPEGSCDPAFRGPFCTGTVCDGAGNCEVVDSNTRIIGLSAPEPASPTMDEFRQYTLAAINAIRARTCLPPLSLDDCLNQIAQTAFDAVGVSHGYFLANCMDGAHDYGRSCQCNWAQENGGMSAGSSRTWVDGVHNPLCRMMTEGFGTGHRSNIESKHWARLGVGGEYSNGASWLHEFGCDASLASCPKNGD